MIKFFSIKLVLGIIFLFFIIFSVLTIIRHNHYQSYGYDLGINDQVVWRYSRFQLPYATIDPFPGRTKFTQHVELVYALVAPAYWIYSSPITLILVRNGWFCFSALAVFLLARKKKINPFLSVVLVISYLGFYGVQNAIWTDVHSNSFGSGLIMWFLYFLEDKRKRLAVLFFFLAITAKENVAVSTFIFSFLYFLRDKSKLLLFFMVSSVLYLLFVFLIFFPHIMHVEYLYSNSGGYFSNFNLLSLIDTPEKRLVIWYSLLSFGFIALLRPLYLLPAFASIFIYFVVASELTGAHGLYGHYRIGLSVFLVFPTIYAIAKYKWLNKWYIGLYLLICVMLVQYVLHLPISYLFKQWFWTEPAAVKNINVMINNYLPRNASIVSQNNITPHISQREKIYTLYPETRKFTDKQFCGQEMCDWFRWEVNAQYLIVDTSDAWDARHFLINRENFIKGVNNLEKAKYIKQYKKVGNTSLYKILKNPNN